MSPRGLAFGKPKGELREIRVRRRTSPTSPRFAARNPGYMRPCFDVSVLLSGAGAGVLRRGGIVVGGA